METDEKRGYKFRRLQELSLIDNYLFGLFAQEAEPEEIKELIECLLSIKISEISLTQKQRSIMHDPESRGIILDAFVTDTEGNIYNIEVQASRFKDIPKRMRYHQSLIDRDHMPSGEYNYKLLPKTIIIFVLNYDIFGKGLFRYTFKNTCLEDTTVSFEDETLKVVLNTRGTNYKGADENLVELLRYFESSDDETAEKSESKFVKKIHGKLSTIKNNTKLGDEYMSYQELIYNEKQQSREEGIKEGLIEGAVQTYFEVGKSTEEIIMSIIKKFTLSRERAEEYVNKYRPAAD